MKKIKINDHITVGGQPDEAELRQLARDGFKTVVNLRTEGEQEQPLSPADEGEQVEKLGMAYRHIPVPQTGLTPHAVDAVRSALDGLATPAFIHCHSGMRAGATVMIDTAIKAHWTGERTIETAMDMGFECKAPAMKAFVKNYVDSHRS